MPDTDPISTDNTTLGGILQQQMPGMLAGNKTLQEKAVALPNTLKKIEAEGTAKEQPYLDKLDKLTADQMRIYQGKPPQTEPTSLIEEWGSPAMLFAIFGSMFTRMPMTSALNAAAAVNKAYQQRDFDAADRAYKQWKESNDLAIKLYEIQSNSLEKAIEKIRSGTKEEKADARADISALSSAYGWGHMKDLIAAGKDEEAVNLFDTNATAIANMKGFQNKADYLKDLEKRSRDFGQKLAAAQKSGDQAAIDALKKEQSDLNQEWREWREAGVTKSGTPKEEHYDASKPVDIVDKDGKVIGHASARESTSKAGWINSDTGEKLEPPPGGKIVPSTARSKNAQQIAFDKFLEENPDATAEDQIRFLQKLRPPRSGPAAAVQKYMDENPNASAADIAAFNAWTRETSTGAVAFGSGPQGNLTRAQNVAIDHMTFLGDDLIPALKNGDQRSLNRLTNWAKSEFGYTGPIDFDFAKQIVSQEVNKAIVNVGAGTEGERANLSGALANANSPEQLMKVLSDAKRLMAGQLRGLEQQYVDVTVPPDKRGDPASVKHAQDSFRQKLFPTTVSELGIDKGRPPAAAPATGSPPPPGTTGQPAALPEGVPPGSTLAGEKDGHPVYRTPDGKLLQVK